MRYDKRYLYVLIVIATAYLYYRYRVDKKKQKSTNESAKDDNIPTVRSKFGTKLIPLKPPRNDSFSKASDLHYKFNYSSSRYDDEEKKEDNNNTFKVITFNALAHCYANASSTYPLYCPSTHLNGKYRFKEIGNILNKCGADIICLQEIDQIDDSLQLMNLSTSKYNITYKKRTNLKQDGLLLAFDRNRFRFYNYMDVCVLKLNDLCLGCSSANSQIYYQKDCIAIYTILEYKQKQKANKLLFIVNTHLFWHPDACDIRLRQISYIFNTINDVVTKIDKNKQISLIFCGDFNSLPHTAPYQFIINGKYVMRAKGNSPLKLIMDGNLNKVCRWTRSLGVDCAYFNQENVSKNTEIANKLFTKCVREDRILVTKSKKLCQRRECPKHLLLDGHIPKNNLKEIIKYFGIKYNEKSIYTRCTLCNGMFRVLKDRKYINSCKQIPHNLKLDNELDANGDSLIFWQCLNVACAQIYWYGTKSKNELQKFQKIYNDIDNEINAEKEKERDKLIKKFKKKRRKELYKNEQNDNDNDNDIDIENELNSKLNLLPNLQRFFWEDVVFSNGLNSRILSSFAEVNDNKLEPEYTNKTGKFQGCLDYIFYSNLGNNHNNLKCIKSELIEGNKQKYPNETWPSDHILLMSTFKMQ